MAALGPLADAVVYDDGDRAVADAPDGDGAIFAIAKGGPVALGLRGERALLSVVEAEPAARGIASTVLRDVYLVEHRRGGGREAGRAPGGIVRHARGRADRARGDPHREGGRRARPGDPRRAEGAGPRPGRDPQRASSRSARALDEIGAEVDVPAGAGRRRRRRHHVGRRAALASSRPSSPDCGRKRRSCGSASSSLDDGMAVWRERLGDAEPVAGRDAGASSHAAAADLGTRRGRDAPSRPVDCSTHACSSSAPSATRSPRTTRSSCAPSWRLRKPRARRRSRRCSRPTTRRWPRPTPATLAAEAERAAAQAEAEVNRAWREASTELDRLRETYEDEDRLRGDIERRIADAERLLREGHRREPDDALAELSEDDSVESLEKKSELVQRRLGSDRPRQPARDRRVRGAPGATRLHGARARRRAQGAARPARGDREGRPGDLGDVRRGLPRRGARVRAADRGAVPRRLRATAS